MELHMNEYDGWVHRIKYYHKYVSIQWLYQMAVPHLLVLVQAESCVIKAPLVRLLNWKKKCVIARKSLFFYNPHSYVVWARCKFCIRVCYSVARSPVQVIIILLFWFQFIQQVKPTLKNNCTLCNYSMCTVTKHTLLSAQFNLSSSLSHTHILFSSENELFGRCHCNISFLLTQILFYVCLVFLFLSLSCSLSLCLCIISSGFVYY